MSEQWIISTSWPGDNKSCFCVSERRNLELLRRTSLGFLLSTSPTFHWILLPSSLHKQKLVWSQGGFSKITGKVETPKINSFFTTNLSQRVWFHGEDTFPPTLAVFDPITEFLSKTGFYTDRFSYILCILFQTKVRFLWDKYLNWSHFPFKKGRNV